MLSDTRLFCGTEQGGVDLIFIERIHRVSGAGLFQASEFLNHRPGY
jgi:hypothetical protein